MGTTHTDFGAGGATDSIMFQAAGVSAPAPTMHVPEAPEDEDDPLISADGMEAYCEKHVWLPASANISAVAVFGDSWAVPEYSWPVMMAGRLPVYMFAQGGSLSETLPEQLDLANTRTPIFRDSASSVLAVIHTGGNDLQSSLGQAPGVFIRRSVCHCTQWAPCYLGMAGFLMVIALLTDRWKLSMILAFFYAMSMVYVYFQMKQHDKNYIIERVANNLGDTMEGLYALGVRHILLAGLPVSPAVPMLSQIARAVPCPTKCMTGLTHMVGSFASSRLQARLQKFSNLHPDCTVAYFDEASELDSLLQPPKSPSNMTPSLDQFWIDPIHPSLIGHLWLASRATKCWTNEQ